MKYRSRVFFSQVNKNIVSVGWSNIIVSGVLSSDGNVKNFAVLRRKNNDADSAKPLNRVTIYSKISDLNIEFIWPSKKTGYDIPLVILLFLLDKLKRA